MLAMVDRINAAIAAAFPMIEGMAVLDDQFHCFHAAMAESERYRGNEYVTTAALYFAVNGESCIVEVHTEYVVVVSGEHGTPLQIMAVVMKIEDALDVKPRSKWRERETSGVSSRLLNL